MMTILSQVNINVILIIIFISIILYIYNKKSHMNYRNSIFDRFSETLVIFEKAKELAYRKTFRDHVLVQSSSGFRINKKEMGTLHSIYIKLVFLFSGSSIIDDLELLYGDMESICSILANEFIQRVDQDESIITNKLSENAEGDMEREIDNG